jgi:uncharacterized membrane protein
MYTEDCIRHTHVVSVPFTYVCVCVRVHAKFCRIHERNRVSVFWVVERQSVFIVCLLLGDSPASDL